MTKFYLRRTSLGGYIQYVARAGDYTRDLAAAQEWPSREAAESERRLNEHVVALTDDVARRLATGEAGA